MNAPVYLPTTNLRRQHALLEQLSQEFLETIATLKDEEGAQDCARQLARITGVLTSHLAIEDKSLYPKLAASSDGVAARTAIAFEKEMGGLASAYGEFAGHWHSGRAIMGNLDQFGVEAKLIFSSLANRIERENQELYPLADALAERI